VLAAVGVAMGTWVIVTAYSPVPYADFWGQLPMIERAYGGDLRISDFWAQANEHRIFLPRIQFVLDYRLFDGTYVFLFSAIAISCLALASAFGAVAWLETRDGLVAWGTSCVATMATMSPVGRENLWWAYQVQFVQVFLFAALAVLAIVVAARRDSWLWTAGCAVAAVAATYSMANGLLVWPIVLVLALVLGLGRRPTAGLAVVGALTVFSYLWHIEFDTHGSLSDPAGVLAYTCVYLGSILRDLESTVAAGVLGGVGLALLAWLVLLAWRRRHGPSIAMPFAVGVGAFVLLTALQTAVGRLDQFGVSQALSSRYTIASFTFWLALLVGFLTPLRERSRAAVPGLLAGAALVGLVLAVTGLPSKTFLRTEVIGKRTTVLGYLAGVDDPSGTLTGGPSGAVVEDAFRWMERERLGPFAPDSWADGLRFDYPSADGLPPCLGAVDSVEPVGRGYRLRGWLAAPGGEDASRNVALLDAGGRPAGRGLVGTHRPDVSETTGSDWSGLIAYASNDPPRPLVLVLLADDRRSGVCRLEAS
jgi:hypothetical protein